MQKLQTILNVTVIASQSTHILCCGLPLLVSLAGLVSGLGLTALLPPGFEAFHDKIHYYELPILAVSGVILALGWVLHVISMRLDCRETAGCHHEPCAPKKKSSFALLVAASLLFAVNAMFFLWHHGVHEHAHAHVHL